MCFVDNGVDVLWSLVTQCKQTNETDFESV